MDGRQSPPPSEPPLVLPPLAKRYGDPPGAQAPVLRPIQDHVHAQQHAEYMQHQHSALARRPFGASPAPPGAPPAPSAQDRISPYGVKPAGAASAPGAMQHDAAPSNQQQQHAPQRIQVHAQGQPQQPPPPPPPPPVPPVAPGPVQMPSSQMQVQQSQQATTQASAQSQPAPMPHAPASPLHQPKSAQANQLKPQQATGRPRIQKPDLHTTLPMQQRQQPPPLPPRPAMLAGPRSSAVMQSIPKVQRQPLPSRPQGPPISHSSLHMQMPPRGPTSSPSPMTQPVSRIVGTSPLVVPQATTSHPQDSSMVQQHQQHQPMYTPLAPPGLFGNRPMPETQPRMRPLPAPLSVPVSHSVHHAQQQHALRGSLVSSPPPRYTGMPGSSAPQIYTKSAAHVQQYVEPSPVSIPEQVPGMTHGSKPMDVVASRPMDMPLPGIEANDARTAVQSVHATDTDVQMENHARAMQPSQMAQMVERDSAPKDLNAGSSAKPLSSASHLPQPPPLPQHPVSVPPSQHGYSVQPSPQEVQTQQQQPVVIEHGYESPQALSATPRSSSFQGAHRMMALHGSGGPPLPPPPPPAPQVPVPAPTPQTQPVMSPRPQQQALPPQQAAPVQPAPVVVGAVAEPPAAQQATEDDKLEDPALRRRQLKVEDALAYLDQVKTQFGDQLVVYNRFLDIMKEFKAQSIDTTEVIKRVSQLFQGHKTLILGFNTFLPPGYKIEVRENKLTGILNAGFQGPGGFCDLPAQRKAVSKVVVPSARGSAKKKAGTISTASPKRKDGKPKPGPSSGASGQLGPAPPAVQPSGASLPHVIDVPVAPNSANRSVSGGGATKGALGPKIASSDGVPNPPPSATIAGASVTNSANKAAAVINGTQVQSSSKALEFERAIGFVNAIRERFEASDSVESFEEFMEVLGRFREEQRSIREVFEVVAELFGPHKDLLAEFKDFLPIIALGGNAGGAKGKSRVATSLSRKVIGGKVGASGATGPGRRGLSGHGSNRARTTARAGGSDLQFFDNFRAQLGSTKSQLYPEFLKCLSLSTQGIITREELLTLTGELLRGHPSANNMFLQYLDSPALGDVGDVPHSSSASSAPAPTAADIARATVYRTKPMSEIAAASTVALTDSYKRLPMDFPDPICSGRSGLERQTVNDVWVSVTTGSADYSFKFMRKNTFEDNLSRCEDDRYELDLVIETNAATIMKMETIVATISKLPPDEKERHALAYGALSPIHFNAIQRIYGDSGPEVILQVKLNPSVSVPVVLARLKERDEHWRRARLDMNRIWRDVVEKNYYRGLDHRSVHFKQVDKKELSTKSLLMDILDPVASVFARDQEMTRARGYAVVGGGGCANDRSRAIEAVLAAARNASELSPRSLELPYDDVSIHTEVFDLIRTACDMSSDREASRVVEEYIDVMSTFFGVGAQGVPSTLSAADATVRPSDTTTDAPTMLYGDEALYILFRLHHLLFERITSAMDVAREVCRDQAMRDRCNRLGASRVEGKSHLPNLAFSPSSLTQSVAAHEVESANFTLRQPPKSPVDLFNEVLLTLRALLAGKIDATKYEDRCRILLGPGSFCLFTLDKTLSKVTKQVLAVFGADSPSRGFLDLFRQCRKKVEQTQKCGAVVDWEGVEALYSVAASANLRKCRTPPANLLRMQYVRREPTRGQLVIHVLGRTCTDDDEKARAAESDAIDQFLGFCASAGEAREAALRATLAEDGNTKLGGGAHAGTDKESVVVTASRTSKRSRKRARSPGASTGATEFLRFVSDPARVDVKKMKVHNGLEFKLDRRGRMCFIDGQNDVLVNLGRKRPWRSSATPAEANARSLWAKQCRRRLNLQASINARAANVGNVAKSAQRDEDSDMPDAPSGLDSTVNVGARVDSGAEVAVDAEALNDEIAPVPASSKGDLEGEDEAPVAKDTEKVVLSAGESDAGPKAVEGNESKPVGQDPGASNVEMVLREADRPGNDARSGDVEGEGV